MDIDDSNQIIKQTLMNLFIKNVSYLKQFEEFGFFKYSIKPEFNESTSNFLFKSRII